jgi:hypothetical protein
LPYIDKALAIDPDAHFGRERYQKWLVEYAMSRRNDGKLTFPVQVMLDETRQAAADARPDFFVRNFNGFLRVRLGKQEEALTIEDYQKAVKGVLGMMRFANYDNPLLLEALGDLLMQDGSPEFDAKRLAARAYLKASYSMKDKNSREQYRELATQALKFQRPRPDGDGSLQLGELETDFASELADADRWYTELKEREIGWIREGKNADAEFDRLYSAEPTVASQDPTADIDRPPSDGTLTRYLIPSSLAGRIALGVGLVAFAVAGVMVFRWASRSTKSIP